MAPQHLPDDFARKLAEVVDFGILDNEGPEQINERLKLALGQVADSSRDLGLRDKLAELKIAIHKEICDAKNQRLRDEYKQILDLGLTTDGVHAVASVITSAVALVSPALSVSSVLIYASIWLLKCGLNNWCALPLTDAAG
jgi:hypothetical protein